MTDWVYQSLSASPLSHAERPCGLAFRRYPDFSCGVQRNSTRAVAGFLMGGLPRGRFGFSMLDIVPVQIILDKPSDGVYSVRTLNQEDGMKKFWMVVEQVALRFGFNRVAARAWLNQVERRS